MRDIAMLVEDEPLAAMDLEARLDELGYAVAGPYRKCSKATAWLKEAAPKLAVVDYSLSDGPCDDLLSELGTRSIPTLVLVRQGAKETPPSSRALQWWLQKPFTPRVIRKALAEVHAARPR